MDFAEKLAMFLSPVDVDFLLAGHRQGGFWGLMADFSPELLSQGRELSVTVGEQKMWADLVVRAAVPEELWEFALDGQTPETFGGAK